jgi:hypothetical protein
MEEIYMAFTRNFLKTMGLTDEQVNGIIEAHTETVDGLKAQVARYKADAEKLPGVQKDLDDLRANNGDDYKAKYEKEKGDFAAYKAKVEKDDANRVKEAKLRKIAKDAGLSEKGIEKAVKYANWDKIELDENGEIKDAPGQIKALREEWPEHIVTKVENNDPTPTPPSNQNATGNGSRAFDLYTAHQAALYGQTTKGESK